MAELTASKLAPAAERRSGRIIRDGLLFASAALMALTLYLVFMWVPTDANMGVSQRILYFHVPVSVLGLLSIVVVAVASGAHLKTGNEKWDSLAYTTAEIGAGLITLSLVTGVIWNKAAWGIWWTWDPKLTTTLILWFIYVGYLMLRAYGPRGSQGARYGAVVALIGAIDAPIIYKAADWWRAAHPSIMLGPLSGPASSMDSRMALALLISMVTFAVLYVYIVMERYSLRRAEAAVDELFRHGV